MKFLETYVVLAGLHLVPPHSAPPKVICFPVCESDKIIRTFPLFLSIFIFLKFCFAKQMLADFWADVYFVLYLHNNKYLYKFHLWWWTGWVTGDKISLNQNQYKG